MGGMRARWLGHACFLLTAGQGGRLLADPYRAGAYGGAVGHAPVRERVEVVVVSHEQHEDHGAVASLPGAPLIVKTPGETIAAGFRIVSRRTAHDPAGGRVLGPNLIHRIEADGVRVAHLGDLGGGLDAAAAAFLSDLDAIFLPVGGRFTVGPREAAALVRRLRPRVAVPMHFRSAKVNLPLATLEEFAAVWGPIERPGVSEIEIEPASGARRSETRVVALEASL
jgi:L-ascorbate metabolism protein UlaG (beta-lactamase superfamily)